MYAGDGAHAFQVSDGPPDQQGDHVVHRRVQQGHHTDGQEYRQPQAALIGDQVGAEEQHHDDDGFQRGVDDGDDDAENGALDRAVEDVGVLFQPPCTQHGPYRVGQGAQHDGNGGGQQKADGTADGHRARRQGGKVHGQEDGHVGGQCHGAGRANGDLNGRDHGDENADGHQQGGRGKTEYMVTAVHKVPPKHKTKNDRCLDTCHSTAKI